MEKVYISAYLNTTEYGKPVYKALETELAAHGYHYKIIFDHSNNEWCRDYMPIKASDGSLVQFTYEPIYLRETKKWIKTIPNVKQIVQDLNLKVRQTSTLRLDGGAIEILGKIGIISNRVIMENHPRTEYQIAEELKTLLHLDKIVIIPIHPADFTGHVDGSVRFIDETTVLINEDKEVLENALKLPANQRKLIQQYFYSLRMSLYNAGLQWEYLTYEEGKPNKEDFNLYLNFLNLRYHIFMPSYGMKEVDDKAQQELESLYKKEVIKVEAKELSKKGGMINCVTWDYSI
jgi:agmatine deiminase